MGQLAPHEMRALRALFDAFLPEDPSPWRRGMPERCAAVLISLPDADNLSRGRLFLRLAA